MGRDYVPVEQISEVADLLKPEVLDKMARKYRVLMLARVLADFLGLISAYGLDAASTNFSRAQKIALALLSKRLLARLLIVPSDTHHKYTIRELHEPKGLLGK